ncbi:DUF2069 domain-containing protein [Arenimonas fontis]|uniref:DUF2069 domain-containing protein n=1 Tax=Arenimonas fontis TaxID=2608255 RepID=A0A5B2Z5R2_9GAMM|nr:DUF2069 domain-containing protein [Arenimonas fontis]KAA2284168.1 DUF2069 domain-containing protein [Arenimonas fontis]
MSPAKRFAAAAIVGLALLPWLWHGWLAPPARMPAWLAAGLHMSPMLPALLLLLARRPAAFFWGAVAALLLFSHGVMEAWASPTARVPALAEAALAAALVLAASWDGLRARAAGRAPGRSRDV